MRVPALETIEPAASDAGLRPLLKWAGGKRGLLPQLAPLLPAGFERRRLLEPFAGGAALFFGYPVPSALLSDVNARLIQTYAAVRAHVDSVIAHLAELAMRHDAATYYEIRARFNSERFACPAEAAAAFIYLNKTCFNGLYRVNRRGEFNVPIGRYTRPRILDSEALLAASRRLRAADLQVAGFQAVLDRAQPGDFVYLDPPYVPRSHTASFAAYAAAGFTEHDQVQLMHVFVELERRGVHAMLSNSDTPFVRTLYRHWDVQRVSARRAVGCSAASRQSVDELVIRNYA